MRYHSDHHSEYDIERERLLGQAEISPADRCDKRHCRADIRVPNCHDRMCGADDCSTCYGAGYVHWDCDDYCDFRCRCVEEVDDAAESD